MPIKILELFKFFIELMQKIAQFKRQKETEEAIGEARAGNQSSLEKIIGRDPNVPSRKYRGMYKRRPKEDNKKKT